MKPTIIRVDMGQKYTSSPIWTVTTPDGVATATNSFSVDGTLVLKQGASSRPGKQSSAWLETTDEVVLSSDTLPHLPEASFDAAKFGYTVGERNVEESYQFPYHLMTYTSFSRLLADPKLQIVTPCRQLMEQSQPACIAYSLADVQVASTITMTGKISGVYINPAVIQPLTCWVETTGKVEVT